MIEENIIPSNPMYDMRFKHFGYFHLDDYQNAPEHQLEKSEKGNRCILCGLEWTGKPRLKCVGLPIVFRKQDIDPNEYTRRELSEQERGEVKRVLMVRPPHADYFLILYQRNKINKETLILRYAIEHLSLEQLIKKNRGKKITASQTIRVETLKQELISEGVTVEEALNIYWKKTLAEDRAYQEELAERRAKRELENKQNSG